MAFILSYIVFYSRELTSPLSSSDGTAYCSRGTSKSEYNYKFCRSNQKIQIDASKKFDYCNILLV